MILSPDCSPALAAGERGSPCAHAACACAGTHCSTLTVVPDWSATPTPTASIHNSTNAIRKCMNDPAAMTIARCHPGLLLNDRGSSAGSTSSMLVMPVILTNPPSGSAFTPYSVSPRRVDQIVVPKPTKNWVAFMPNAFAVAKCPASCSMTETSNATTKMSTPIRKLTAATLPPGEVRLWHAGDDWSPSARLRKLTRALARPAVSRQHVVQPGDPRTRPAVF